ncbi:hypothetical protein C0J52_21792 [Blattella germanica]|nr:hypothetical protein C0J52_21792 [Blattella germanica]
MRIGHRKGSYKQRPIVGGVATDIGRFPYQTISWGTTIAGGEMAKVLQKVEVPVLPFWECEWLYNTYKLTQYMFCAGRAGRDSCQGDSGGPVMFDGQQVGVVSWGEGCGFAGYPGIYTNVYKFRDWIRKHSGV